MRPTIAKMAIVLMVMMLAAPLAVNAQKAEQAVPTVGVLAPQSLEVTPWYLAFLERLHEVFRRAAAYVERILKGTKPGDLPVEQPTKFELSVNLKTAQSLSLSIPQQVPLQADHVIK